MVAGSKARDESVLEFTVRAAAAGIVFGILFGAANAYLGLRVGLTVTTSIPIAVLTVAFFRAIRANGFTILEANLSQTIGSASSSLASGTIFTIPALFLWGMAPPFWQVAILAFLGAILGICAMVPLRRLLIVDSAKELPYPEGTACAEVLKVTTSESASGGKWIALGLVVGATAKIGLGGFGLFRPELHLALPGIPKAELSLEVAAALLAVGYILGYRQAAIMVAGSLISALCFIPLIAIVGDSLATPLFPELEKPIRDLGAGAIWSRYVRYIGAGAVAAAGIVTVARSLPTMWASLKAVLTGLSAQRGEGAAASVDRRTDRDIPGWVVIAGPALVVLTLIAVPGLLAGEMSLGPRTLAALGVGLFGVLFVVVSSRIVGLIGVSSNPTSGMTLVTLLAISLIFVALGWKDPSARAAILTVGMVVCVAASKAGDISQDLKTGYLVGATPARQQLGQFLGAAFACWAVAGTVILLGKTYGFGTGELGAPQAMLMKTVIDGVLTGSLPWGLVGTGAGLSVAGMLAGLPGLAFAVGIYLPLSSMTPIFVGGLVRRVVEARRGEGAIDSDPGILAASGLIAGEGLAGVLIALLAAARETWAESGFAAAMRMVHFGEKGFSWVTGLPATLLALTLVVGLCGLLFRAGRAAGRAG
ncbi:MAG TPA: oligopeptide transporter, OPT family [Thermoanaerobaculia bacterium]|nr:oligopeptide transporter, OPT family [Thermoanaerobaculia bacterium]